VEPYATGRFANVSKRKTKAVRTSKDLAAIVQRMREDLAEGGQEEWENRTLDAFLETLAAVLDDVDLPAPPSWSDVADVLVTATGYE
jgi:hypothetical protein